MNEEAFQALATLSLMAAFADGNADASEREKLKEIFASFGELGPATYRQVLMGETSIAAQAACLTTLEAKQLAFEMAVAVCDADGATTEKEHAFLDELRDALGLGAEYARGVEQKAESLATASVSTSDETVLNAGSITPPVIAPAAAATGPSSAELDSMILKYAILNGALELLPQSLATMAILPMQMKMVYRVGKSHGIELDSGHIKEFLAVVGVGMGSQMLENFMRKVIGSFTRKTLGKGVGRLAKGATGPMLTFATTYALGQVAKRYYAGGRKLSTDDLRAVFSSQVEEARGLYGNYAGAVENRAQNLSMSEVMGMVRGTA